MSQLGTQTRPLSARAFREKSELRLCDEECVWGLVRGRDVAASQEGGGRTRARQRRRGELGGKGCADSAPRGYVMKMLYEYVARNVGIRKTKLYMLKRH